jgi:hypothetical protein
MKNEIIINSETSFKETVAFLKKYFDNVREVKNENSHLANRSQNFWTTIIFESRNATFPKWTQYLMFNTIKRYEYYMKKQERLEKK